MPVHPKYINGDNKLTNSNMKKLLMCRICLSNNIPLRSLVNTQLEKMYEALTMMPLVAEDSRPSLACDLCCSRLETCYELRRQSLSSEELFTQLLRHKVQVNLQVMLDMYRSMEDVMQTTADVLDNGAVEQDDTKDNVAVEQEDADPYHSALGLHTECDIPLDIVKEEPDDVDTGALRPAAQKCCKAAIFNKLQGSNQSIDMVENPKKETENIVEDKQVETREKIYIRLRNNKQKNSTFYHNDAYSVMSENKFSADQSINSSKLRQMLSTHMGTHTGEKPYECNICAKCVTHKGNLQVHMRTHTGEKPYECNICAKFFTLKCNLKAHIRTHMDKKPYKCSVCKKCFIRKDIFTSHMRTHTGEKPYECNICAKCFSHKNNLKIHMRTHTGEKPYECNICARFFTLKCNLKAHIRTHMDKKPYKCSVCKKCFIRKDIFTSHMRTHTGEKPYECNICAKCFSHKNNLKIHMRTHTGEKPYECNICARFFTLKCNLKAHIRTHTNEKPYECSVCKKCFTRKAALNDHMRTHTGEKPYECDICKKCFSYKCALPRHIRKHMGEIPY